jgi:hypothetical protein
MWSSCTRWQNYWEIESSGGELPLFATGGCWSQADAAALQPSGRLGCQGLAAAEEGPAEGRVTRSVRQAIARVDRTVEGEQKAMNDLKLAEYDVFALLTPDS